MDTEISLPGASNHGGSVGSLVSNRLGAGAEMKWVEESTADEADLGARVQQHEQISSGPIRQVHGECEENLVAFVGVSYLGELKGGVLADELGQ